jgi:PKD repeat protein
MPVVSDSVNNTINNTVNTTPDINETPATPYPTGTMREIEPEETAVVETTVETVVPTTVPTTIPTTIPTVSPRLSDGVLASSLNTEVVLSDGVVHFSDKSSEIYVESTVLVNDNLFVPVKSTTTDDTLTWDSPANIAVRESIIDEIIDIIIGEGDTGGDLTQVTEGSEPPVKIQYNYVGNTLKEQITIQQDVELKFPITLSPGTKIVPFKDGRYKVVSSTVNDLMSGVVIARPFGIDADGKYIEMDYALGGTTLTLTYDRNQKIAYPLVIDPTWYVDNPYCIGHMINGSSSGTVYGYPITMVLFNTTGTSSGEGCYLGSGKTRTDWGDVRFTQDNSTELPYWFETMSNNSTSIRVWVNMSSITGGTTNQTPLFVYYGNSSKTNVSNGTNTFILFDDFDNGTTLDTSKWINYVATTTVANSHVTVVPTGSSLQGIYSIATFGTNYSYRAKGNAGISALKYPTLGFITTSNTNQSTLQYNSDSGNKIYGKYQYVENDYVDTGIATSNYQDYIFDITRNGSTSIIGKINNGAYIATSTGSTKVTLNTLPAAIFSYGTTISINVDWVLVRPYIYSEPTHSTYTSTASAPSPQAPNWTPDSYFGAIDSSHNPTFWFSCGNNTTDAITGWNWSFGDGTYSSSQNTSKTYTSNANYTVNLTVTNASGSNSTVRYVLVERFNNFTNVTVNGSTANQTNYQVMFTLWNTTGTSTGANAYLGNTTRYNWSDFRFTTTNNTDCDYWIENMTPTNVSLWVEIPTIPTTGTVLNLFYSNSSIGYNLSNGTNTFPFFDHFDNGTTLNTNKWYVQNTPTISSSIITCSGTSAVASSITFKTNYTIRTRSNIKTALYSGIGFDTGFGGAPMFDIEYQTHGTNALWHRNNAGSDAWGNSFGPTDVYAIYNLVRNSTTSTLASQNSDTTSVVTTQVPTGSLNASIWSFSGSSPSISTDWILVRKYSYTEPTPYTWSGITSIPTSSFTTNVTSGTSPLSVQFNDTSVTSITSWNWSFNNVTGNSTWIIFNTTKNATQVFNFGNFSIKLNVTNASGYNESTTPYFINVSAAPLAPVANFTSNVTSGLDRQGVLFTDTSTNTPTNWNWSFQNVTGNNTLVYFNTSQNPIHSFGVGNYSIVLNASNAVGYNLSTRIHFINVSLSATTPVANFTSNVTSGYPHFWVQFNDTSTNTPTSWLWDFGDGYTNASRNASHNYSSIIGNTSATYTVTLTTSNEAGGNTTTRVGYITAYPLSANFSANTTSTKIGRTVVFNSTYANGTATTWSWDFGDLNTSATRNATNIYGTPGNYTVRLNVSNTYSYNWSQRVNYIYVSNITPPVANFTANTTAGPEPLTIQFYDNSTNSPTSWAWDFINSGTTNSTSQNPTCTYMSSGYYTVKLTATNEDGSSNLTRVNYIHVTASLKIFPTCTQYPKDINADGLYEDTNGNSRKDFDDVVVFFIYNDWARSNEPEALFDFNGNGRIDFNDIIVLFDSGGYS